MPETEENFPQKSIEIRDDITSMKQEQSQNKKELLEIIKVNAKIKMKMLRKTPRHFNKKQLRENNMKIKV